jgi:hypothetical protein
MGLRSGAGRGALSCEICKQQYAVVPSPVWLSPAQRAHNVTLATLGCATLQEVVFRCAAQLIGTSFAVLIMRPPLAPPCASTSLHTVLAFLPPTRCRQLHNYATMRALASGLWSALHPSIMGLKVGCSSCWPQRTGARSS